MDYDFVKLMGVQLLVSALRVQALQRRQGLRQLHRAQGIQGRAGLRQGQLPSNDTAAMMQRVACLITRQAAQRKQSKPHTKTQKGQHGERQEGSLLGGASGRNGGSADDIGSSGSGGQPTGGYESGELPGWGAQDRNAAASADEPRDQRC
ncbi:hypothetical protein EJB05_13761, partial [Eragrostis curvula]